MTSQLVVNEAPKDPRLVEAEIARLQAETLKLKNEAAAFEEDAKVKAAEARKSAAYAISAEYNAEAVRIQTEASQRQEQLSKSSNHLHHVYMFSEKVDSQEVDLCLAQLAVWDRMDPVCPMNIIINSPGGSVIDGMHLFDQIDSYSLRGHGKHKVTITIRGWAASMAGILVQAADERVMGRQSTLMIHEVASFARGKIGEIEDEVAFLKELSSRVANIFLDRASEAHAKGTATKPITREDFDSVEHGWRRKDWYLNAHQALELGFVDRIG